MSKRDTRTPEERELAAMRDAAARRDERMNEIMSRRDVLDAIDAALFSIQDRDTASYVVARITLQVLKEAFE